MISFKRFLSESEVTPMANKSMSDTEALDYIKKHCSKSYDAFVKTGKVLYRGWRDEIPVGLVRPQTGKRASENTSNFYTQLIDTNPANADYPDRQKSLICTTDYDKSSNYGNPSIVFPVDGAEIAVCPRADIWDIEASFPDVSFDVGIFHMNEPVEYILDYFDITNVTYDAFEYAVDSIDDDSFRKLFIEMFPSVEGYSKSDIEEFKRSWKNLYFLKDNNVKLVNSVRDISRKSHECWFSDDCIVIDYNSRKWLKAQK